MKKSDLKNGMVVETRDGEFGIVLENVSYHDNENGTIIKFKNSFNDIGGWNEDLKSNYISERSIYKVYNFKSWGCNFNYIEKFIDKNQLLWERKQEIDWTKVPRGTMIKIKDCKNEEWEERELIAYLGDDISASHKFICKSKINKGQYYHWKFATIDNPKQEWLK